MSFQKALANVKQARDQLSDWAHKAPIQLQSDHFVVLAHYLDEAIQLLDPGTEPRRRFLLNVGTTSKGVKSYSATVEIESNMATLADALREFDAMMEEMDARIHPEVE